MTTTASTPGWYPVPDQANALRHFDGTTAGETIPAPGLDALEQIAADVRLIKSAALLWMVLTVIGLIVVVVAVLSD